MHFKISISNNYCALHFYHVLLYRHTKYFKYCSLNNVLYKNIWVRVQKAQKNKNKGRKGGKKKYPGVGDCDVWDNLDCPSVVPLMSLIVLHTSATDELIALRRLPKASRAAIR